MCSKDTVREGGIERDGKERKERIEEIEDIESDTEVVIELGGRDGEIETTMESTKIGEGRERWQEETIVVMVMRAAVGVAKGVAVMDIAVCTIAMLGGSSNE